MSMQTTMDITLQVTVPSDPTNPLSTPLVSTERRITPSWTVSQLKSKLEPITGIPSSCQTIQSTDLSGKSIVLSPDTAVVGGFGLVKGNEIFVLDSRPAVARQNFTDVSSVEKYMMPEAQYEKLEDSVLAWKKKQKLGRFDPHAKTLDQLVAERREQDAADLKQNGIELDARCRVGKSDERRGVVKFVGEIEGLGGDREKGCIWVGVEFDEPVGRNDGSVELDADPEDGKAPKTRRRIFKAKGNNYAAFARPGNVEAGPEFGVLDDLLDENMEEL